LPSASADPANAGNMLIKGALATFLKNQCG